MTTSALRRTILGVLCCLLLALTGCETVLLSDLPEADANEVVAHLYTHGIAASKMPGAKNTTTVMVDEADLPRSVAVLGAAALPRMRYNSLGSVFKKEGVVSTPLEEQARLIYALSQEVAASISLIDGVVAARVHVVLPTTDVFGGDISPSSAAVFIKHKHDVSLEGDVGKIKKMVEHSIKGLRYEAISVFLFPSEKFGEMPGVAWKTVLGLRVAPGSVWGVWLLLALAVGGLGGAAGLVLWQRRKAGGKIL